MPTRGLLMYEYHLGSTDEIVMLQLIESQCVSILTYMRLKSFMSPTKINVADSELPTTPSFGGSSVIELGNL